MYNQNIFKNANEITFVCNKGWLNFAVKFQKNVWEKKTMGYVKRIKRDTIWRAAYCLAKTNDYYASENQLLTDFYPFDYTQIYSKAKLRLKIAAVINFHIEEGVVSHSRSN